MSPDIDPKEELTAWQKVWPILVVSVLCLLFMIGMIGGFVYNSWLFILAVIIGAIFMAG